MRLVAKIKLVVAKVVAIAGRIEKKETVGKNAPVTKVSPVARPKPTIPRG